MCCGAAASGTGYGGYTLAYMGHWGGAVNVHTGIELLDGVGVIVDFCIYLLVVGCYPTLKALRKCRNFQTTLNVVRRSTCVVEVSLGV